MIIARLAGGLGNQLFQYAMARRLAERHNTELLLDTAVFAPDSIQRHPDLTAFNRKLGVFQFHVKAREATPAEIAQLRDPYWSSSTTDRLVRFVRRFNPEFLTRKSHITERQFRFQPEALDYPDNIYVQGYWQSEKYFADVKPIIKKELTLVDKTVTDSAKQTVAKLKARYPEVVALHVRRGDGAYAHEILGRKDITCSGPVTKDYIEKAMKHFAPEVCFFVFSDTPQDIEWCRKNVRARNVEFSTATSDIWDFAAMSCCDHNIIGNSTFSWWAAWLNPNPARRVIAPREWSPPEATAQMYPDDLVPEDWIMV